MTAWVGAGSALAVQTSLCKSGVVKPYCNSSEQYSSGTVVNAVAYDFSVNSPGINISCSESKLEAESTAAAGEPLPLKLKAWTLSGCKTANGTSCVVTPSGMSAYTGGVAWASQDDGVMTIGNAKFETGWELECGFIVDCMFNPKAASLTVNGGQSGGVPATIVADKEPLEGAGDGICPSPASTMSATYTVTSPSEIFVTRAEAPPSSPVTALCKAVQKWCEAPNLYPSGTSFTAKATNLAFETGTAMGNITCKEASFTGKTEAAYAEPLPMSMTSFGLSGCNWGTGESNPCSVTAIGLHSGSLAKTAGTVNGSWKGNGLEWQVSCGFFITCKMGMPSESTLEFVGGSPAAVKFANTNLTLKSCSSFSSVKLGAKTFTISTPDPIFVEDAVR